MNGDLFIQLFLRFVMKAEILTVAKVWTQHLHATFFACADNCFLQSNYGFRKFHFRAILWLLYSVFSFLNVTTVAPITPRPKARSTNGVMANVVAEAMYPYAN